MAYNIIDTASAGYQTRLTQLTDIKSFYGPRLAEYLNEPPDRQAIWRANDPILHHLLDIIEKFNEREEIS